MGSAERYGDPMDLWRARRDAEKVDADPELAAWVSSGTLDSPWASLETLDPPLETSEIVAELSAMDAEAEGQDG